MAGVDIQEPSATAEIICTICSDVFTNARDLPCGHTFCLSCLGRKDISQCPECNDAISEAPEKLRVNSQKNTLVGMEMARRGKPYCHIRKMLKVRSDSLHTSTV